jgi:hypothetical protein
MQGNFAEKVKGFLVKPIETFKATQSEGLSSAYQYYVILLVIYSILFAIVISVLLGTSLYLSPISAALGTSGARIIDAFMPFLVSYLMFLPYFVFMLMLFGVFLAGFYYHVFVLLFGGQKGLTQTVKTVMYAYTPFFILGWIPFISIIGIVWSWILLILGFKENQDLSIGRAVLVWLVPLILMIILVLGMFAVLGSFLGAIASIVPK